MMRYFLFISRAYFAIYGGDAAHARALNAFGRGQQRGDSPNYAFMPVRYIAPFTDIDTR